MAPHGAALHAFFAGDTEAQLIVRRDDGLEIPLPVSHFFRDASQFTGIDNAALEHCRGHVLDVGAGTGLHSLVLQEKGLSVTSIDTSPQAVEIMEQRGVRDARCIDIFGFQGGPFRTILMMGHGIGMVETITGLDRFLTHAHSLLAEDGRLLLDSLDVRTTDDPSNLTYLEANRRAGRYVGEVRLEFEFREKRGPPCGWLHVDASTLKERAEALGWHCEVILQEPSGDYLAQLIRRVGGRE
jgi:SAM-dependent methyltransferase